MYTHANAGHSMVSFNLILEILLFDRQKILGCRYHGNEFQSHSWDSSLWSWLGIIFCVLIILVSISFLRFFSLIGDRRATRKRPTISFQSHSWDSSLWSVRAAPLFANRYRRFNLILEILLFDRDSDDDEGSPLLEFQSHSWDSSLWSMLKDRAMDEEGYVSISFLRFFSLIVSCTKNAQSN